MWSGNRSGYDSTELFMQTLAATSDISENIFSFYLTGLEGESYIDFGTPNPAVTTETPIYIDIEDEDYWWTAELTGFKWGSGMSDKKEYKLSKGPLALTDTGSSCIIGPKSEVKRI